MGYRYRNGWESYGMLYDIGFSKKISEEDGKKELENLGIDLQYITIEEDYEESWEEV